MKNEVEPTPLPAKVLYEKVGRRYVPVQVEVEWQVIRFPLGRYVVVNDGNGSSCSALGPHPPEVQAALMLLKRKLCELIRNAALPKFPDLTLEEANRVLAYVNRIRGTQSCRLWQEPAVWEIVDKAVDDLAADLGNSK